MKRKWKQTLCIAASVLFAFAAGCGRPEPVQPTPDDPGDETDTIVRTETDTRNLSPYAYTTANVGCTDALGRTVRSGDRENGKYVGMFYHIWQGYHTKDVGIYDITKLLATNPDILYDIEAGADSASPVGVFHYWGEPLYGYYCSDDPWLITRHMELLTMAGIDYLGYDLTNSVIYVDAINAIFEVLENLQNQGFKVPKVLFYTNTNSASTIRRCYDMWYKTGKYSDLWFRFDEKPVIVGVSSDFTAAERDRYMNFFDFRESQWPYGYDQDLENGFPWMDWNYPQTNYSGSMSVSLAQHPGARMSNGPKSNHGRGFDYEQFTNVSGNTEKGTNYAGQWETVYKNSDAVNNVFLTGFNEWIAIKYEDGEEVYFVDTFNEEYSRDIEMMKGGYFDNYYLQTVDSVKKFKYTEAKHYLYQQKTVDIEDETFADWAGVTANFKDFTGDAMARNFRNADGSAMYTDSSNRNDITDVSVVHDQTNLYVKVKTAAHITPHNGVDLNWMNLFLKTKETTDSFAGFNFVVNRKPNGSKTSVEVSKGGYSWETAGNADCRIYGDTMIFSIPLSTLGLDAENCSISVKVADNVKDYDDIADYYIRGDSAPIGRLGYLYGY